MAALIGHMPRGGAAAGNADPGPRDGAGPGTACAVPLLKRYTAPQAAAVADLRRRTTITMPVKPIIIIIQLDASGTGATALPPPMA